MTLKGSQQAQLRQLFVDLFKLSELRDLCFDLDIEYENLEGITLADKARELIAMMDRLGRIEELLKAAQAMRPNADWQAIVPASSLNLFPLHQIAYPHNPNFTGRSAILDQIEKTLSSGQTTVVTQAIAGLGGVGKTQLALAYCYAHLDDYDLIYWLAADSETNLGDSFRALGQALKLATPADTDQQAIMQRVLRWLGQAEQRWLLVYDNADEIEPKQLTTYLPRTGSGQVLITSRNPNWRSVGNVLELNVFSQEESVAFLTTRGGSETQENADEKSLAETLGYFPLALEHAAAYIESTSSSYAAYQQLFETVRQDLWRDIEAPNSYHATIATTWQLAFKQIKQVPGSLDLLNLCCLLAPDEIPLDLITDYAETMPNDLSLILKNPIDHDKAVAGLLRYSLIQRKGNDLNIHRLVQIVARDRMDKALIYKWVEAAVSFLSSAYIYDEYKLETWEPSQRLLNHNQVSARWAQKYSILPEKSVQLLNDTTEYFRRYSDFQAGLSTIRQALDFSERLLGPDHPNTASSLNNQGLLLQAMGDLVAARPHLERALAIRENVLGSDHPDTARSLNNLGFLLNAVGDLPGARPYFERALAINEKTLGSDHPDTATILNNLGGLLQDMGDLAAAWPYYENARAIFENTLGPDHPHTATSLNNLGSLLQAMGDMTAARSYYEDALAIREKTLGPDNPDTARSLNNLGGLLQVMGELVTARPYFERSLIINEKTLGPDHPDTARSLNNLGGLLQAMGDLVTARPYFERALAIREKTLGLDHPDTVISLNNFGRHLLLEGKLVSARDSFERALEISERTKGGDHPDLVKILTRLGRILVSLDQIYLARKYLNRARAICHEETETYNDCLEVEELLNRLPGKIGKPKRKKKKRWR